MHYIGVTYHCMSSSNVSKCHYVKLGCVDRKLVYSWAQLNACVQCPYKCASSLLVFSESEWYDTSDSCAVRSH